MRTSLALRSPDLTLLEYIWGSSSTILREARTGTGPQSQSVARAGLDLRPVMVSESPTLVTGILQRHPLQSTSCLPLSRVPRCRGGVGVGRWPLHVLKLAFAGTVRTKGGKSRRGGLISQQYSLHGSEALHPLI